MRTLTVIIVTASIIMAVAGCWHGEKNQIYTGPPPRTVDLDDVENEANPRYAKYIYPPDSLVVGFVVPGNEPCRVSIEVRKTVKSVVRKVVDSVFAPGSHTYVWSVKNDRGVGMKYDLYFYYLEICDKVSTRRLDYRRKVE